MINFECIRKCLQENCLLNILNGHGIAASTTHVVSLV